MKAAPTTVTGIDGKTYQARPSSPDERRYLAGRVHYLHHQGMSIRQIVIALQDVHGVRRSVGWTSETLRRWKCSECSGE